MRITSPRPAYFYTQTDNDVCQVKHFEYEPQKCSGLRATLAHGKETVDSRNKQFREENETDFLVDLRSKHLPRGL